MIVTTKKTVIMILCIKYIHIYMFYRKKRKKKKSFYIVGDEEDDASIAFTII